MKARIFDLLKILPLCLLITACGSRPVILGPGGSKTLPANVITTQQPYVINGRTYYPLPSSQGYEEEGIASWYGHDFHGRKTSCGETYDMYARTAAHKTLPINTYLLVRNLENGKKIVVRVNDRGPFVAGRVVDLSLTAARDLDIIRQGTARVRITALGEAVSTGRGGKTTPTFLPHGDFETGEFYVQVGSFENAANADRLKDQMRRRGHQTVIQVHDNGRAVYYRVQVYAGKTLARARQMEKKFRAAKIPGIVVAR